MRGSSSSKDVQPHRGDDLHRRLDDLALVARHALGLVGDVERADALGVLGGDADRAGVGVAGLGLDAADGHHHRARGVGVVGALDDPLDDVDAGGDLAGGADLDPVAQPDADQRVVHGHQRLGQRHPDVVGELHRRRAGAALGAVDDDEVGGDALLDHRLADRQQVDARAEAELEAGRLAAGQLAQPRDEADQLARGGERPVVGRRDHRLARSARRGSRRSRR